MVFVSPNTSPKLADLWNCFQLDFIWHGALESSIMLSHVLVYRWNQFKQMKSAPCSNTNSKELFRRHCKRNNNSSNNNVWKMKWLIRTHVFDELRLSGSFFYSYIFQPNKYKVATDNNFDSVFIFRHQRCCAHAVDTINACLSFICFSSSSFLLAADICNSIFFSFFVCKSKRLRVEIWFGLKLDQTYIKKILQKIEISECFFRIPDRIISVYLNSVNCCWLFLTRLLLFCTSKN